MTAEPPRSSAGGPAHCPPELLAGAKKFRVRSGFTGLRWSPVANRLSPAARAFLRRELPPVAVETFTGTDQQYWTDWLSDANLDDLQGSQLFGPPCKAVLFCVKMYP